MLLSFTAIFVAAVVCIAWLLQNRRRHQGNELRLPLPPGPWPRPFVGNVFDLPTSHLWQTISQWSTIYGNIISARVFRNNYIFLNSRQDARELLDKRSAIYSDRPQAPLTMIREIIGWMDVFSFQSYGEDWRQQRKIFHHFFHLNAVEPYQPIELMVLRKMLLNLIEQPEEFLYLTRHAIGSIALRIGYGIEDSDAFIPMAEMAAEHVNLGGNPGAFWVNEFPILKYIPRWFPGAGWKRLGKVWNDHLQTFSTAPFEVAKSMIASNKSHYSVVREILRSGNFRLDEANREHIAKWIAATIYVTATETTTSTLHVFLLAMVLHPDVQSKAQVELDSVVGQGRLPDYSDKPKLPYLGAVLTEVLRWQPVVPFGLPHATSKADNFQGYFIPKGAIVMPNIWHMTRDKSIYPDPDSFRPERWLNEDGQLDQSASVLDSVVFGFGRRVCPGRHLAMDTLFAAAASILATFRLDPLIDASGQPIPVREEYSSGITSSPEPFKCRISPRYEDVAIRIRSSLGD